MSQFITLNDPLVDLREAHRNVLTGSLSKIAPFRVSLSSTSTSQLNASSPAPNYLRQKVSLRVKQEELTALQEHHNSLHRNYHKLKHNLKAYARSSSLKMNSTFQRPFLGQPNKEDLARLSHKSQKEDKTVFVDRKYNTQFAISTAMASEVTQIATQKARIRRMMSATLESPLIRQAKQAYAQSRQDNRPKRNPVLTAKSPVGLRKKKKGHNYTFAEKSKK